MSTSRHRVVNIPFSLQHHEDIILIIASILYFSSVQLYPHRYSLQYIVLDVTLKYIVFDLAVNLDNVSSSTLNNISTLLLLSSVYRPSHHFFQYIVLVVIFVNILSFVLLSSVYRLHRHFRQYNVLIVIFVKILLSLSLSSVYYIRRHFRQYIVLGIFVNILTSVTVVSISS